MSFFDTFFASISAPETGSDNKASSSGTGNSGTALLVDVPVDDPAKKKVAKSALLNMMFDSLDEDKNGWLSKEEIREWLENEPGQSSAAPGPGPGPGSQTSAGDSKDGDDDVQNLAGSLMSGLDANNDNKITRDEFFSAFEQASLEETSAWLSNILGQSASLNGMKETWIKNVFAAVDYDKSGEVSMVEFDYWFQHEPFFQDDRNSSLKKDLLSAMTNASSGGAINFDQFKFVLSTLPMKTLRALSESILTRGGEHSRKMLKRSKSQETMFHTMLRLLFRSIKSSDEKSLAKDNVFQFADSINIRSKLDMSEVDSVASVSEQQFVNMFSEFCAAEVDVICRQYVMST
jgi:Ca2+-binding EF-hand superfamily protein